MTELVTDCPRCGSRKITFDVTQANIIGIQYGWQQWYEAFCTCRHCRKATIFVLSESAYYRRSKIGPKSPDKMRPVRSAGTAMCTRCKMCTGKMGE